MPLINTSFPHLLHGGDYNPEQWIDTPAIWDEDMRLMKLARINSATVGIFAWASLEPEEGRFTFDWLDRVMDSLARNGQRVILATPSGAKPNWLALKYEEVRRVDVRGCREPQQGRHNHCWTSPIYREKVREINTKLAERYGNHPALLLWHLSNEYGNATSNGPYCYCRLCFSEFHAWLRERFGTVERMNAAFWSRFWSHTYSSFEQVTDIDPSVHGLELAWKRFMTDRVVSFIRDESDPLRRLTPDIPVTTNFCGTFPAFDYWTVAKDLDVVSWDSYPTWHGNEGNHRTAIGAAFVHDIHRSMKGGKPFVLMESTPSQTNWQRVSRLKRPGMHQLSSLQAIAHGSDAVLYFQFRKSRGSSEKCHGAVVDHVGHENTRVFNEVAKLGHDLAGLDSIAGTVTRADVAVIYDWQNEWAINQAQLPRNASKDYLATCLAHYSPFWRRGITVDVIDSVQDLQQYKIIVAPMLYMLRPGVSERIEQFVAAGGTFIATYLTGLVDENDLCFLGGFPGPLRKLMGIWVEETDTLDDGHSVPIVPADDNCFRLPNASARHFCDLVHLETANAIANYGAEFYAGTPAVTINQFEKGRTIYIASRNDDDFTDALIASILQEAGITTSVIGGNEPLPSGVTIQKRGNGDAATSFVMNFSDVPVQLDLGGNAYIDVLAQTSLRGRSELAPFTTLVLRAPRAAL